MEKITPSGKKESSDLKRMRNIVLNISKLGQQDFCVSEFKGCIAPKALA